MRGSNVRVESSVGVIWVVQVARVPQVWVKRSSVVIGSQEKSIVVGVVSPPSIRWIVSPDSDQLGLKLYLSASS